MATRLSSPPPPPTGARRPLLVVAVALVLVAPASAPTSLPARRGSSPWTGSRSPARRRPSPPRIRAALRTLRGRSLVRFDRNDAARRLATVAEVADARFDRDFPHTLKVRVRLERPVAVLRRGADAWLVSATARVLRAAGAAALSAAAADLAAGGHGRLGELDPRRRRRAMGVAAVAPLRPLHSARTSARC